MNPSSSETELTESGNSQLIATFLLGNAVFGIDAQLVQEVIKVGDITPVYHAPAFVVGIRNLRGRIVTIIDLRVKLDLGCVEPGSESRILIVDRQGEQVGLLVDTVSDAISIESSDIKPPPPNVHNVQSQNLRGICRGGDRLLGLLDLSRIFLADDRALPKTTREAPSS